MRSARSSQLARFILAMLVVLAACVRGSSEDEEPWGQATSEYFTELAAAYTENDYYRILDFYDVDAFVEVWRGDIWGGLLVRDYLLWNSGDLGHSVRSSHIGLSGALTVVEWESSPGLSAIHSELEDGLIVKEVIYDHAAWLSQAFRSSTEITAAYEDLYLRFADGWVDERPALAEIYHDDVVLRDPLTSGGLRGRSALEETFGWASAIDTIEVTSPTVTGPRAGSAVFQGPADFGAEPGRAVGLYDVTDNSGCVAELAVVWEVSDGLVVAEERFWGADAFEDCDGTVPPPGWWTGLGLPGPSDGRVTGTIETIDGHVIEVHNGTPLLENLLIDGLTRFSDAGLDQPKLDSITFEPSRACEARSGRLLQDAESRDVFLCLYETDLCSVGVECAQPSLNVRSNVLHELGHAWILDHVDDDERRLLLEISGREVWQDLDVPWPERGVEYAAEVIAWGLFEEPPPMARINRPSCDELRAAFRALTQTMPLVSQGPCAGP